MNMLIFRQSMLEAKYIKAIVKYEHSQDVFTYIDLVINAF